MVAPYLGARDAYTEVWSESLSPTPPCFLWRPETALCSTQGADVMCGVAVDLLVLAWCSRSKLRCTLYVTEVLRQFGPRGLSHTLVR